MADIMINLPEDRPRTEEMGRDGRVRVEAQFTHDRTAERLREIMGLTC